MACSLFTIGSSCGILDTLIKQTEIAHLFDAWVYQVYQSSCTVVDSLPRMHRRSRIQEFVLRLDYKWRIARKSLVCEHSLRFRGCVQSPSSPIMCCTIGNMRETKVTSGGLGTRDVLHRKTVSRFESTGTTPPSTMRSRDSPTHYIGQPQVPTSRSHRIQIHLLNDGLKCPGLIETCIQLGIDEMDQNNDTAILGSPLLESAMWRSFPFSFTAGGSLVTSLRTRSIHLT